MGSNISLVYAHVVIRPYDIGSVTGDDGLYKISITDSLLNKRVQIECLYVGYQKFRKKIRLRRLPYQVNITLQEGRLDF